MRVRDVGNREWKIKKREKGGLTVDLRSIIQTLNHVKQRERMNTFGREDDAVLLGHDWFNNQCREGRPKILMVAMITNVIRMTGWYHHRCNDGNVFF